MKTRLTLKKIGITALLGIALSGVWAQSTQDRNVGTFTGVKTSGIFTVSLTPGANAVKVEAEDSVINDIKTEVKDDVLIISSEGNLNTKKQINITVSVKDLKSVNVSGAAKIKGDGEFATDKITVDATGAGSVALQLKATDVNVSGSGAGNIKLTGSATNLKADLSGAANLKAYDLEVQNASIDASGASNAKVNPSQSIKADASGASNVSYKGNPASKSINKSGGSSVKSADAGNDDASAKGDTTKVKVGDSSVMIITGDDEKDKDKNKEHKKKKNNDNDDSFNHWKGVDIGVSGFLNADNKLGVSESFKFLELDYARSMTWSINFMEKDIHLYKNYINLVTGLGFQFDQYGFKNNITLDPHASYITASYDSIDYKVNRLRTSWVNLPVLIDFNTSKNPNKAFHIAGGIVLGYRMHAKAKQEFTIDKREYEVTTKDDYNLAPFRYSATVRAGYGDLTLFANYALSTLFEKNKGPKLYPFSVGVALNFD